MAIQSAPMVRILAEIEREHRALTSLMARLSPTQLTQGPPGGWSAIDTLNHVTAWQANALRIAESQAAPDAPELDPSLTPGRVLGIDVERFNADIQAQHGQISLDEALGWHNRVHMALLKALVSLPPKRVLGGPGPHGAQMWYARPAIIHTREHRQELEARLAQAGR